MPKDITSTTCHNHAMAIATTKIILTGLNEGLGNTAYAWLASEVSRAMSGLSSETVMGNTSVGA